MLKTETKDIDGLSVAVTQFAGRRNLAILIELSTLIGPTLAATAGSAKLDDLINAEIDIERVARTLVESMQKNNVMALIDKLLENTSVNDRKVDSGEFDRLFAGRDLWKLPKILMFVIEVNFGNFSELGANVIGAAAQVDKESKPRAS